MEAGGPISKRRRSGRGVGADRISALPDAVLGEIVSLLPAADGGRTQILASRWRHIWRSAPLNLDCDNLLNFGTRGFAGRVRLVVSSHLGPGRRFRVRACWIDEPSDSGNTRSTVVDDWLRFPALDNLEELDVCYAPEHPAPPLSPSILRFSATLRVVSLADCNLSDSIVQGLCFPKLARLALTRVSISECSLSHMVAGRPALECLKIYGSFGFRCARINSISLISIGVRAECYERNEIQCRELIIENAPCLRRLLHLDDLSSRTSEDLKICVLSAPKLETLRCVFKKDYLSTILSFGSMIVQGLHVDSLTEVVRTVKILDVALNHLSLDIVINWMRCFPCLKKLYIKIIFKPRGTSENNLWRRKYRNLTRCLDMRLKTIMLKFYWGSISEINFLTFFVLNAKVLESVTLVVKDNNEEFIAKQSSKLQLENKASKGAQFNFTTRIDAGYLADVQCL